MSIRVRGRSRVIDILLIAALAVAGPIPAFATETHQFDVPAEDAPTAIRDFASQAHVQILVAGENVSEKRFHPVAGEFSTEEGLRLLLADSGLSPQYVGDRSIALVKASDANSSSQGTAKEGKQGSSQDFRVAQVDQGKSAGASSLGEQASASQENSRGPSTGLEEITVTAQKKSERLQDVPVPVTVIAAQTLIDNNQLRLQDYYTSVPGLNLSTDPYGAPAISIRGITTGGFTNPTVGIVVDDVPYGSSSSHGYGQEILGVDPTDLASVEVLRGPQGTLYGASSLGGLIKYVTVEPSPEAFSGQVGAGLTDVHNGAEPGYNLSASVNLPITDTLALRVSGYTHQDAGYIDDPALNLKGVNEGWADGGHVAALWRPSQDFSLKLSALVQYDKMNGVSEADVAPGLGVLQQNDIPGSGASNRALEAYTATIRANLGTVALTSLSGYTSLRNTQYDDYTNAFSSVPTLIE
jgi:iron complex outermembrane recepter protein